MSVPVPKRGHGELEVNSKARALTVYTLKILENEKWFPKEQGAFIAKLQDCAIEIQALCWEANNIKVGDSMERYRRRSKQPGRSTGDLRTRPGAESAAGRAWTHPGRPGWTTSARETAGGFGSGWKNSIGSYGKEKKTMEIKRLMMTPAEMAALENAEAQAVRNAANIDYIAMMADVEIPTEEEGGNDESEI